MAHITRQDALVHEVHGSTFTSYVRSSSGSRKLCAWELSVPANTHGAAHTVGDEEVLRILSGQLTITIDGAACDAREGDAVLFPAGATVRVDNTSDAEATAWVVTSAGLTATLADGTVMAPPWAQ